MMLPFSSLPSSRVVWTIYLAVVAVSVLTHAAHAWLTEYRHTHRRIDARLQRLAPPGPARPTRRTICGSSKPPHHHPEELFPNPNRRRTEP